MVLSLVGIIILVGLIGGVFSLKRRLDRLMAERSLFYARAVRVLYLVLAVLSLVLSVLALRKFMVEDIHLIKDGSTLTFIRIFSDYKTIIYAISWSALFTPGIAYAVIITRMSREYNGRYRLLLIIRWAIAIAFAIQLLFGIFVVSGLLALVQS